jgi:hypothetical protein
VYKITIIYVTDWVTKVDVWDLKSDTYAIPAFGVEGVMQNMPGFYFFQNK